MQRTGILVMKIDTKYFLVWLPALLIWISVFFILLGTGNHDFQRFAIQYGFIFFGFNILALAAGVYQLVQLYWQKNQRIPFVVYMLGLMVCLTFGTH